MDCVFCDYVQIDQYILSHEHIRTRNAGHERPGRATTTSAEQTLSSASRVDASSIKQRSNRTQSSGAEAKRHEGLQMRRILAEFLPRRRGI